MQKDLRITVWNEFLHETMFKEIREIYPDGIHGCIADFLKEAGYQNVKTATLEENEHGLTDDVLNNTDVLIWWGHMAHDRVQDAVVEKVYNRVMQGMGLIGLHSAHASKIMRKLLGTDSHLLRWREAGEKEILWVVNPSHPIAEGVNDKIILEHEEMYGETFIIPRPDDVVFLSWFEGGEVFRSGVTYTRGRGKIFYFRPGHEAFPTFFNKEIQRVILNAVEWAKPLKNAPKCTLGEIKEPLNPLSNPTLNVIEGLHNQK
ncbi:MAG: ThuA domain-containing protein [Eubacteriales bacterium]|nr:ThuA domain-containing protein [Eubacteriales bacterium]